MEELSGEWELTSASFRCTVKSRFYTDKTWQSTCFCFRGGTWYLKLSNQNSFYLYIHRRQGSPNGAFPAYVHLEGAEDATGRTTNVDGTRTWFQLLHLSFDELRRLLPSYPLVIVRVFLGEKKDCTRTIEQTSGCGERVQRSTESGGKIMQPREEEWELTSASIRCTVDIGKRKHLSLFENNSVQTLSLMTTTPFLQAPSSPCLDNLLDDMAKLLQEDNPDTDVFLLCGDLKFKAHKAILSARSPVLSRMLHSDMEEGRTGKVTVHDMAPESFHHFLQYLYTGKLTDLTVDSARNLLEAGDRFEVPALVKRCEDYLVDNLTEENVYEMLLLSDVHRALTLKEAAGAYIVRKNLPLKAEWPSFCRDHPLLACDVLNQSFKLQKKL